MAQTFRESTKDASFHVAVQGRHQAIYRNAADDFKNPVFAAGAVLWRFAGADEKEGLQNQPDNLSQNFPIVTDIEDVEVAVIHRPFYDDWSLAKGKVDPGESLAVTAKREITEETGYRIRLGKLLGHVSYPIKRHTKVVYYWLAFVVGGAFRANSEVDEIRWLPFSQARDLLTYEADKLVLDAAKKRLALPTTSRVILVRHAHAGKRVEWTADDNERPLTKKGLKQAGALAEVLHAYRPTNLYSAEPVRCVDTLAAFQDAYGAGLKVTVDPLFGDAGWLENPEAARKRLKAVIAQPGVAVVVSQGDAIPQAIEWLVPQGTLPLEEIPAKKSSIWVLSFHLGKLVGADYLESPLPLH